MMIRMVSWVPKISEGKCNILLTNIHSKHTIKVNPPRLGSESNARATMVQ